MYSFPLFVKEEEPGFQTGHASEEGIFSEILVREQKRRDGSSVGELFETGKFFLNELQK